MWLIQTSQAQPPERALTTCYPAFGMSDDLVIFVRRDSAVEKRAFASAEAGLAAPDIETNRTLIEPPRLAHANLF